MFHFIIGTMALKAKYLLLHPNSGTYQLCDLGQIISDPCASVSYFMEVPTSLDCCANYQRYVM